MEREIKFRAWDGQKMYLPQHSDEKDFYLNCEGHICFQKEVGYEGHLVNYERRGWALMQSTGLKDKNGVDIYEGDIVENRDGDKRQILYVANSFEMRLLTGERDSSNVTWYFQVEVIGNIYQNI